MSVASFLVAYFFLLLMLPELELKFVIRVKEPKLKKLPEGALKSSELKPQKLLFCLEFRELYNINTPSRISLSERR